jgi:hypothetical protein
MAANSWRGTATSASWKTLYLACDTTFAPILSWINRSRIARADDVVRVLDDLRHELARVELTPPNQERVGGTQPIKVDS